jgi:hypothetical protein
MNSVPGRHKVLNQLEQPQWPEIRKGPPRWQSSKRTNKVDVGSVVMESDSYPETWGHAILTRSYTSGQDQYGRKPHHTMTVDEEFRPPTEQQEDLLPISRQKRPKVFGRINPGGGRTKAQNTSLNQVSGWLKEDERVVKGSIAPTFESPITFFEPPSQPDLSRVLPDYSVTAGEKHTPIISLNPPMNIVLAKNIPPTEFGAGFLPKYPAGTPLEFYDITLRKTLPEISFVVPSNQLPLFEAFETPLLENNLPPVSYGAGISAKAVGFEKFEFSLEEVGLHPNVDAGFETPLRINRELIDEKHIDLQENRPVVSVGSGHRSTFSESPKEPKHLEARRIAPRTGPYHIPNAAINDRKPIDTASEGKREYNRARIGNYRQQSGFGPSPVRFKPSTPVWHPKSDAMRHHIEVPSQRPVTFVSF